MNSDQKAEVGLLIWTVETEKARERQLATLKRGDKLPDTPSEGGTGEYGGAIRIAAEERQLATRMVGRGYKSKILW